jgi:hypothetical protein
MMAALAGQMVMRDMDARDLYWRSTIVAWKDATEKTLRADQIHVVFLP